MAVLYAPRMRADSYRRRDIRDASVSVYPSQPQIPAQTSFFFALLPTPTTTYQTTVRTRTKCS
ncbi:uncharacterized protein K489DRAFT_384691 [Dissoconium aciculare CBS 342.82]|uniref:Uncharacterized protein n=1 Tax=Dissoconium aciculare CBS 342.82 TaxID=1314786 RepID=A0A6J3LSM5_9PEZI|nr:uncharacterized protein K489DRAFT_384691 [Dissoconium aciculare CBS 342.82]KAF1818781.1 hypothetical protein K489DRAFT_384691 [Dissoconium aciculare CBS 342.82]